jgi:hypothetical protein
MLGHDCSPSQPESLTTASDSLNEVFMEPLLMDEPSSSFEPVEFNFEFSDHNYRLVLLFIDVMALSYNSETDLLEPCAARFHSILWGFKKLLFPLLRFRHCLKCYTFQLRDLEKYKSQLMIPHQTFLKICGTFCSSVINV